MAKRLRAPINKGFLTLIICTDLDNGYYQITILLDFFLQVVKFFGLKFIFLRLFWTKVYFFT